MSLPAFAASDHWAICATAYRYSHALGARDWSRLGDCFSEDGEMDLSAGAAPAHGRAEIVETISRNMSGFVTLQQNLGSPEVFVDPSGVTAHARFYVFSHYLLGAENPEPLRAGGVYDDNFVRRGRDWLIRRRRIRVYWTIGHGQIRPSILADSEGIQ